MIEFSCQPVRTNNDVEGWHEKLSRHARKEMLIFTARRNEHRKRCTSYGNSVRLSVHPSVRLSHAGIVSKRRHVARCSLHCQIAKFV